VVENENLILRKDKDLLTRQLESLEPLKKLRDTVDKLKFEKNQSLVLGEENEIRLKKEIDRLSKENIMLERKNKEISEFKTKQDLELKSKDY